MESTIFDMCSVHGVVEQVKNYIDDDLSVEDEVEPVDDADTRRNRFHCVGAWRHAILLYAQRSPQSHRLDSARCIPLTETIQKQVLLPVFLAAAEVEDEWNREFAREYCRYWNGRSQFSQFEDAAGTPGGG
ncbi:hypothetical protein VUR80DRAFT_5918 [Thermomyces stellatus]